LFIQNAYDPFAECVVEPGNPTPARSVEVHNPALGLVFLDRGNSVNSEAVQLALAVCEVRWGMGVLPARIEKQAIRRGSVASVRDLMIKIWAFITGWNDRKHPFVWTKPADDILDEIDRQRKHVSTTRH
jgi:hypothetical protein